MAILAGRTALVTGGSKGIGAAIAKAMAAAGANVAVTARGEASLTSLVDEISSAGGQALSIRSDATDEKSVAQAIDAAVSHFGGLDILVNNVGGPTEFSGFWSLTDEDWLACYDVNVVSAVRFTRHAVPHLKQSKAPRIINMSSISAIEPGTFNPHYSVTKAALINLSKHLSNLLVKDGILVNCVCPGPVHSDSWEQNVERLARERGVSLEESRATVEKEESAKVPLGRIGEGGDVAGMVVFLASDEASWITGSCFKVDGGKLRSSL